MEHVLELVCSSEKKVIGSINGESGMRLSAEVIQKILTLKPPWTDNQKDWDKSVTDGQPLQCTRCWSALYMKTPEDSLTAALDTKLGLILGGARIA